MIELNVLSQIFIGVAITVRKLKWRFWVIDEQVLRKSWERGRENFYWSSVLWLQSLTCVFIQSCVAKQL
jgi:hypothetical protein